MPSASLYVRLSEAAGTTNLSLEGMLDELRQLADREGLDVFAEHVDDGFSGAIRDRPEFTAWLDDARLGHVDVLMAYHADRLSREGVNVAGIILDVLEGKDPTTGKVVRPPVRLLSEDGLDSERDAEAFRWRFVIAAEVARAERERIKARAMRNRVRLKKAGRFAGGGVPYGTRVVERDGLKYLERDPEEAAVLEEVASRLIRGDSMRSVLRWLNDSGHRTRRGNLWYYTGLRATLESETTATHVLSSSTLRALKETFHPAPSERQRGGRPQRWLLVKGLAVCASCGAVMRAAVGRYHCGRNVSSASCPAPVSIDAKATDEYVASEFLARFGRLEHFEPRVVISGADELAEAEDAVEEAERALLAEPTAETAQALREARERLDEVKARPQSRERRLVPTGRTIAETFKALDVPDQARLLSDALAGPVVIERGVRGHFDTGRIHVEWRGGESGRYYAE